MKHTFRLSNVDDPKRMEYQKNVTSKVSRAIAILKRGANDMAHLDHMENRRAAVSSRNVQTHTGGEHERTSRGAIINRGKLILHTTATVGGGPLLTRGARPQ